MLQNAGFGTIPCGGGGGGVVANREPGSYMTIYKSQVLILFFESLVLAFPSNKHYMNLCEYINLPIFSLVKCFSPRKETASF